MRNPASAEGPVRDEIDLWRIRCTAFARIALAICAVAIEAACTGAGAAADAAGSDAATVAGGSGGQDAGSTPDAAAVGPDARTGASDVGPSDARPGGAARADSAAHGDTPAQFDGQADAAAGTDAGAPGGADGGPPSKDGGADAGEVGPALDKFALGFVTLLTGKVVVVELKSLTVQALLGAGHGHTHGVGVMPGQQAVWYGNPDDQALDRYEQVKGDPAKWKLVTSVPAPAPFKYVDISRNGAMMALAPDVHFVKGTAPPSKVVLLFDTKLQAFAPPITLAAPTVAALTADGTIAYVANSLSKSVSVIDTKTAKAVDEWTWPACPVNAPMSYLTFADTSPDDKTLAVCTFGGRTLALYDLVTPAAPLIIKFPKFVHWMAFSPDSKTAYVVTVDGISVPGDEQANAAMPTTLERVDVATGTVLASTKWKYGYAHIGMPPVGSSVFVTGSFSTLLQYDTATLALLAEGPVQPGLPTPAMTITF